MKKNTGRPSFADAGVSHRKTTNLFLERVNQLMDWERIEGVIDSYATRGRGIAGNTAYPGLVLVKMSLLGIWYKLSDRALEERVNDSISFNRFCGLSLADRVPDHSVISRFRTMMTRAGGWDALLREVNRQLEANRLVVKSGVIVDASITESPRKPGGKPNFEIEQDEPGDNAGTGQSDRGKGQLKMIPKQGVDGEAKWTKKAGKSYYGFKKHHATDVNGLILAVETTPANTHDSQVFEALINQVNPEKGTRCYADKGYAGQDRVNYLAGKGLKNGIQSKAYRNRPLSRRAIQRNKLISKLRYIVERTFGGQKRWFDAGTARYVGWAATHTQHVLEAICYNLKRAPQHYIIKLTAQ